MLTLEDKNSDFLHVGDSVRSNSYYDIDINFEHGEVYGTDAIDQSIENLIFTDHGERIFNWSFGTPLKDILFEKNTDASSLRESIYEAIESFIPITINRDSADIGSIDNNPHIFFISFNYSTNDGLVINHQFSTRFKF